MTSSSHWKEKVVVVTGGSEGLGYSITREFAAAGAKVVMLARGQEKLERAAKELGSWGEVSTVVADVTNDASVAASIENILKSHGRIDVWVNNVGVSLRIQLSDSTVADYQRMMEINFYSAVRASLAVLPALRVTSGMIINIGSLASKTAWPNIGPYAASKHALAAFSHQLRIEPPTNVDCLLVCPGPIRRGDAGTRYAGSNTDAAALAPGAGVKLKGICPDHLARKIVTAAERRQRELVIPWKSKILFTIAQISPWLGDRLLKLMNRDKN